MGSQHACRHAEGCGRMPGAKCSACRFFEASKNWTYNVLAFPTEAVHPGRPKKLRMWLREEHDD